MSFCSLSFHVMSLSPMSYFRSILLSVIQPNVTQLNVFLLIAILPSGHLAKCHSTECHFTESHSTKRHSAQRHSHESHSAEHWSEHAEFCPMECFSGERCSACCHSAKCHVTMCGTLKPELIWTIYHWDEKKLDNFSYFSAKMCHIFFPITFSINTQEQLLPFLGSKPGTVAVKNFTRVSHPFYERNRRLVANIIKRF